MSVTAWRLDWRDSAHYGHTLQPCQHCRFPTRLRDGAGAPSHKVRRPALALTADRRAYGAG